MLSEIEHSKEINIQFKYSRVYESIEETGIEFTVEILSDGSFWRGSQEEDCILPPEMKKLTTNFETFYN